VPRGFSQAADAVLGNRLGNPASARRSVKPTAYKWSQWGDTPHYPGVPTQVLYGSGTVPTLLAPFGDPQYPRGDSAFLLNNKNKAGDYGLWTLTFSEELPYWRFTGDYFTGITRDGVYGETWEITKSGELFGPLGSSYYVHYFSPLTFTSVAVRNPPAPNPGGFLFATSKTKTYSGSGAPGSQVMLLQTSPSQWPKGTWKQMPFGAYQLSADPDGEIIADLDSEGNVWEIKATRNKSGKFIGWVIYPLNDVLCSRKSLGISFLQVAVKKATFLGLTYPGSGSYRMGVWYYDAKDTCWVKIGQKNNFVSIAVDPDVGNGQSLVWASDSNANIWYVAQ
jgi:hypothetical protein